MKQLKYPFDSDYILRKKQSIKRELLADETRKYIDKKIAILCGSTANEIKDILELFLLDQGIRPSFYMSEYNRYWEDVIFDNPELRAFGPDIIYIHTTSRNVQRWPKVSDSAEAVNECLNETFGHFYAVWEKIAKVYQCVDCYLFLRNLQWPDLTCP